MERLWLRVQLFWVRLQLAYTNWRLRRHGIDPDAIPEIQELRRRYQADKDFTTKAQTDRSPDRPDRLDT